MQVTPSNSVAKFIIVTCLGSMALFAHAANNSYIVDNLTTPVYDKPDSDKVIKTIQGGTAIQLLQTNPQGWSQIKLTPKSKGWLRTQLISSNPGLKIKIKETQEQFLKSQQTINSKKLEIKFLREELDELKKQNVFYKKNNFVITTELKQLRKIAKEPNLIYQRNEQLLKQVEFLNFDNSILRRGLDRIQKKSQSNWQVLLLISIVIAYLFGYLVRRKKRESLIDNWDL